MKKKPPHTTDKMASPFTCEKTTNYYTMRIFINVNLRQFLPDQGFYLPKREAHMYQSRSYSNFYPRKHGCIVISPVRT